MSLFISPDLIPTGASGKLGQFKHFVHWANELRDASKVELFDEHGVIPAKPLTGVLEAELWDAVFPADTPVRRRSTR